MKTALILAVKNQGEFAPWTTLPPLLTRGGEVVLIVGYPEGAKIKDYNRQKVKMIRCPYEESITQMFTQINELLGGPKEYDVIFTYGIEQPVLYINGGNIIQVKDRQEVKDKFNSLSTQKTPSPQPAPKEKEGPKEKTKGNKKKKAKEEKTEEKKEKEEGSLAPPGIQEEEKEKEEKTEEKKETKEEKKEEEKKEETEASSEKEKKKEEKEKESPEEKEEEERKEKDEGDEKDKGKEEEKEEKQITYVFDPYTQENYRYLYPKKYMRTTSNSDDMKEWKDRWFGEQVYVSRLALMQAAWIICEVFQVGEISSDDAMQVIQLIMRCRGYEDFNSSASNVLSNDRLRFNIDKNDLTSQDVAAASFKRLSQVASWYTALSRLLTEKITD